MPTTTGNHSFWRDEEELVDYEPEEQAAFSPVGDDISVPEDHTPTLDQGPANISPIINDLPAYLTDDATMAGRKRRQKFSEEEEEQSRKATKTYRQPSQLGVVSPRILATKTYRQPSQSLGLAITCFFYFFQDFLIF